MAIYLPILTSFNDKGLKQAEKGFKDLEGAQAKAKYALGKANKYAAVALGGLVAGLVDATKAAIEDQAAANLLAIALGKSTTATAAAIKENGNFIDSLMMSTNTADDILRPAMARLSRSTGDVTEAQKLLSLAVDIAKGSGKSLETVTAALAKGYDGNTNALGKLGLGLDQSLIKSKDFGAITEQLTKNFGGFGKAAGETTEGQLAKFTLGIAELKEGIGSALLPILEKALPVLQKFSTWAQDNPTLITAVAVAFGVLAASVVLVNAAMALNPVALITAGIVALGIAIVMAYKKFDTFRSVVRTVVNGVAGYFEFMANAFITMINLVIKGINLIKPGKDIGTLGSVSFGQMGGDGGGGNTGSARGFEVMAAGGIVTGPTMALIGEAGPEAVIPLDKMSAMGGVTINVNGGDPNAVVQALRTYMRQNGSVPIKISNAF